MCCFRRKLVLFCLLVWLSTGFAQNLEVTITNMRSSKGQFCVALFDSEEGFKKEHPCWEGIYPKSSLDLNMDKAVLTIRVPEGSYGLSVLDDENMDKKMNYSIIRLPREGFGFSGYEHKGIRKPRFDQFVFKVEEGEKIEVEVVLKYF